MRVDVVMPTSKIPKKLNAWLDDNLPVDIKIRRGVKKGRKVVCFSIYGSTQEDIFAKWEALEIIIG